MATIGGSDLLTATVTPSTDVSSTRAGLGGSFDFQGQVSGSAARSGKPAAITAADATMAPMTMGRFIILSLEVLLVCLQALVLARGGSGKVPIFPSLKARAHLPLAVGCCGTVERG